MFEVFYNALQVPELRKRLRILMFMFLIFGIGSHIPVPGVNTASLFANPLGKGTLFNFIDMFSGGSMRRFSIFALGIIPYINAEIIMQLLTIVIPKLEQLAKEDEEGRKVIKKITRYLTVALAIVQSSGLYFFMRSQGQDVVLSNSIFFIIFVVITLTAGTAFLMWLGEFETKNGIGNGISLLIFAGIVQSMPGEIMNIVNTIKSSGRYSYLLLFVLLLVGITWGIVYVTKGERRIPVQYAKRVIGRKVYGGQSTYIPLRVAQAGVIPIIFAISILYFPSTIATFLSIPTLNMLVQKFMNSVILFNLAYFLLVFVFAFFYTAVIFNPADVAERLRKYGGFILGIRPGKPTIDYLEKIMIKVTTIGALFLGIVAIFPRVIGYLFPTIGGFELGGTGLLIVVGVALETIEQMEAHVIMRQYEGFMK